MNLVYLFFYYQDKQTVYPYHYNFFQTDYLRLFNLYLTPSEGFHKPFPHTNKTNLTTRKVLKSNVLHKMFADHFTFNKIRRFSK